MRGRRWGLAWGAALLAFLLVAPPGLSVTGSGVVVASLPVQLWGPLEAQAPGGGLSVQGGDFDGALHLARGRVTLTTLELVLGPLGGLRRTTEVVAGPGALLELYPASAAKLAAWGPARLSTSGEARLALPHGEAFALEHGGEALAFPFPERSAVVEARHATASVEGTLHVLLTDAAVRVRRGASDVLDLDLQPSTSLRVDGAELPVTRPRELASPLADNLDDLAARAAPLAPRELTELSVQEVLVKRYLEVEGIGTLALRSHGALLQAFSRAPAVHVLGAAAIPVAQGEVALLGKPVALRGETAQAAGDFWLRTMPGDGHERRMSLGGTFHTFAVNGRVVEPPMAGQAALALGALAALGLASPALKPLASRAAAALYARIPASDVLSSDVRRRVYGLVQQEPGLSLSELALRAGLSWGNTVHHLSVLKRSGLVVSMRHGRYRRWFVTGAVDQGQRGQVAALRNPVSARIARLVLDAPGLSQRQLADRMAMTPQAVHWHLARLEAAGLVERVRDGREVRHYVRASPPPSQALSAAAAPAPAPQPLPL